jgi:WD40 repeat protein
MAIRRIVLLCLIFIAFFNLTFTYAQSEFPPITAENAKSIKLIAQVGQGSIKRVDWSPDGKWMAVGSQQGVWLYSVDRERPAQLLTPAVTAEAVSFSPDSQTLVAGGNDSVLLRWSVMDGKPLKSFQLGGASVSALRHTADGKTILAGGYNGTVLSLDARTGTRKVVVNDPGHLYTVISLSLNKDGSRLLAGSSEGRMWLYDPKTGNAIRAYSRKDSALFAGEWTADETGLIGVYTDGLRSWSLGGKDTIISESGQTIRYRAGGISPNRELLATVHNTEQGHTLTITSLKTKQPILERSGKGRLVQAAHFSPDSTKIALFTEDEGIQILSLEKSDSVEKSHHYFSIRPNRMVITPDSSKVIVAGEDGQLRAWGLPGANFLGSFVGHGGLLTSGYFSVFDLSLSEDGKLLATSGVDETLRLWDVDSRTLLETYNEEVVFRRVAISPSGKHLAASDGLGKLFLWDTQSDNKRARRTQIDTDLWIGFVDEDRIIVLGYDKVAIYSWEQQAPLGSFTYPVAGNLYGVALTADRQHLALGFDNNRVIFADLTLKSQLQITLPGLPQRIATNTRYVAVSGGSEKGEVRLYTTIEDGATGGSQRPVAVFNTQEYISTLALSPGSRFVVVALNNHSFQVYGVSP